MKIIFFWGLFSVFVILLIAQMITLIPILKKETSTEEKLKRQPKILMLNSLMMIFGSIMLMISAKQTGPFVCGIIFFAIGLLNLIISVIRICLIKKKEIAIVFIHTDRNLEGEKWTRNKIKFYLS